MYIQSVDPPYHGGKIIVDPFALLSDRSYSLVSNFVEEIEPEKYVEIEPEEIEYATRPTNVFFDERVNYVYLFEFRYWLFFKNKALFLWSKTDNEWLLRVGDNGYALSKDISNLEYLNEKIVDKAEELRTRGDPKYWGNNFGRLIYFIPSESEGEIYFLFSNLEWSVSLNQKDWVLASSVAKGDTSKMRSLSENELNMIIELGSKRFTDGLGILSAKTVYGRLETL